MTAQARLMNQRRKP
uniref:Uncharacterized protein n=1 Tax=Anguilla anguilla TaxID=7936 RepID=A0A0E9PK96_ANGAN